VEQASSSRRALVLAAIAVVVLDKFVPFGELALYPLTLLATWVHEMGHGLSALAVGGHFLRLEIFANASGLAHSSVAPGWRDGVVAAGGLLAPPVVGALTLALVRGPRRARVFLLALAAALVTSLLIWVRTTTGWIAMPLVALLAGVLGARSTPNHRLFASQLVGLCLALDTIARIDYLFRARVRIDGVDLDSDISAVAQAFGGNYLWWGALLAALSLLLVAGGLYFAFRAGTTQGSRARPGAPRTSTL
jgi:Peptidase M50B-like